MNGTPERLVSTMEAAQFLALDASTLKRWRRTGGGPAFVKVSGNRCRYSLEELKAWIESRTRRSTADPGRAA